MGAEVVVADMLDIIAVRAATQDAQGILGHNNLRVARQVWTG